MAGVPSGTERRGASRPERPVDAGAGRSGSLPGRNLAGWGPRASRRSGECFQARDSGRQLRSAGNKTRTDTLVSSRSSGGDNNIKSRPPPGRAALGRSARCPQHRSRPEQGAEDARGRFGGRVWERSSPTLPFSPDPTPASPVSSLQLTPEKMAVQKAGMAPGLICLSEQPPRSLT